jgi:hypothetical protein
MGITLIRVYHPTNAFPFASALTAKRRGGSPGTLMGFMVFPDSHLILDVINRSQLILWIRTKIKTIA